MKHFNTASHRSFFKVLHATRSAQAAMMVLQPGQATGEAPENEHPWAEQWLFVISGAGRAKVGESRVTLRENFAAADREGGGPPGREHGPPAAGHAQPLCAAGVHA